MITEEIKQELVEAGVNYTELLKRFMNMDKMAEKFLIRYLDDPTMDQYKEVLDKNDVEQLFRVTHTLKGVCGNLCLDGMLEIVVPAVEVYRAGKLDGAAETYERVKAVYDNICAVINKIK